MRTSVFKYAYTGKLDQYINNRHRISVSYNYTKENDNTAGLSAPLPPPFGGRVLYRYPFNNNGRMSYDWTISPRTLNHLAFGITRQEQLVQSPTEGGNWSSVLGIPNIPNGAFPQLNYAPLHLTRNARALQHNQQHLHACGRGHIRSRPPHDQSRF